MFVKLKINYSIGLMFFVFLLVTVFSITCFAASQAELVYKVNTSSKVIALTFDDGDDGGSITEVLRILSENNIKATFFITGKAAEAHPDLIRSIQANGHQIANHSYSHPYFSTMTAVQIKDQVDRTETVIKNITGQSTKPYFRPPYGDVNTAVLQALGDDGYSKTIKWTVDTLDWKGISAAEINQRALSGATPGGIILMHVGSGATYTPAALPSMISNLKSSGYTFATIDQILNYTPSSNNQYVVKSGDTLWGISRQFGVTVQQIVAANNIANANLIYVGQVLNISGTSNTSPVPVNPSGSSRYVVKSRDTLWKISTAYGVTVQQIVAANNITNANLIYPGQVLNIPSKSGSTIPPVVTPPSANTYVVRAGDTLWAISRKYGVTIQSLATVNKILVPSLIYPNMVLIIP